MVRNKVAPVEDGANIQRNFEPPPPYTTPTDSPEDKIRSNSTATTASQPEFQGCWTIVVVAILFIINLLNYMDRYTIAG